MIKCGIDIGGTNTKIGFFENDKKIEYISFKTPKLKKDIIPKIVRSIKKRYDLNKILGYTVALPGSLKDKVVMFAPNTDIVGLNFYEELKKELNNPNIIVDNDGNIQALAEAHACNLQDLILITIGTGLGGGIILDGKLINKNGFAGEIGHVKVSFNKLSRICGCGKKGCAEAYISCKAIVKEYNEKMLSNINSKELFTLAYNKDPLALKCVNDCARKLAILIADLTTTLGIKEIHIAGGMSNTGEFFLRRVRYYYSYYCLPNLEDVTIKRAYLKYDTGIWAGNYLIKD